MAIIKGLDAFRAHFAGHEEHYVLIGGVACSLAMDDAGLPFRLTKDFDIVLCYEVLDARFVGHFWEFVKAGRYEVRERSTGKRLFYRFRRPEDTNYPDMLELFCRQPDGLTLPEESHVTPIPMDEQASSLSAILLDPEYYDCVDLGRRMVDGVSVLGPEYILPFKAKAWLDLVERKARGDSIDSRDIKKHRNDVFRLFPLMNEDQRVEITNSVRIDLGNFLNSMAREEDIDLSNLGVKTRSLADVLAVIRSIYGIEIESRLSR